MKKSVLIILLMISYTLDAATQVPAVGRYRMKISYSDARYNDGRRGCFDNFILSLEDDVIRDNNLGCYNRGDIVRIPNDNRLITKVPQWIKIHTYIDFTEWLVDDASADSYYNIDFAKGYIIEDVKYNSWNEDIVPYTTGSMHISIIPDTMAFACLDSKLEINEQNLLPYSDVIVMKATKGFLTNVYNWKYSVDGGVSWNAFPSTGPIYSTDKSEVTFKGFDLVNDLDIFKSYIATEESNTNILIGVSYDNSNNVQWQYVLSPTLTAPKILSVKSTPETCLGQENAMLTVTFDRQLLDKNEVLYLKLNGVIPEGTDPILIDNNKQGTVSSLKPSTYDLEVVSTYNGYKSYTGSDDHSKFGVHIDPRPAINFPVPIPVAATCYGGNDGTIAVTASRESGAKFTAYLHKNNSTEVFPPLEFGDGGVPVFVGLTSGEYEVTLKDENGCTPKAANGSNVIHTVIVAEPQLAVGLDGDIALQEPKGFNTQDGIFVFNINGGSGNYSVQIQNTENNTRPSCSVVVTNNNCVVSGIGRGTYSITITDGSYRPEFGVMCGCRLDFQYTVTAPDPIVPKISNNKNAVCYTDNNGSANITAVGGRPYDPSIGTYDFTWYKKGEATPFFEEYKKTESVYSLLKAGDYTIVVKDKNGIEANTDFTILEPNPVLVNFVTRNINCYGGSDGSVSVVASGGSEKYKTQLIGGENYSKELEFDSKTSAEFTGLAAGNYYLYLTDMNGCPIRDGNDVGKIVEYYEIAIIEPKKPVKIELKDTRLPISYDSEDGAVVVRVLGGTTQNGDYKIVAKPASGGATLSHSSSIKDGVYMTYTFTGLKRGRYIIEAGDDNYSEATEPHCGCVDMIEVEMISPESMEVTIKEIENVRCYGSSTAKVMANARGGVRYLGASMPYIYKWYRVDRGTTEKLDMVNDSIAENLGAGSYQVEVFDMKDVMVASDVLIVLEPDSLSISFEVTDIDCSGANTGSIVATVTGGTAPYNYQWNVSGQSDAQISNLPMGVYTLMVADSKGCSKEAKVEVSSAVRISVDSIVVQPNCSSPNGGRIELKLSGGSAPYSVLWTDNNSADLKRENLNAGNYKVIITDNKGCRVPYEFKLHEPHSFTVTLPEDLMLCRNQSRTIKAECKEPDVTYRWYRGDKELLGKESLITTSEPGVYRVIATNPVGCTAQDELVVTVSNETLNLDMIAPTTVATGSEIHAVNLSTVSAETLVWNLPKEAIILKRDDTEAVFILEKAGTYEVSLEGFKTGCSTIITRVIEIVGRDDNKLPDDKKSLIKQFLVTPNPTTGYFKVMVELNREDDFTMKLYSPSGVLIDEKSGIKVLNKSFEYEINGSIQGIYLLHLITPYDKAVLQVVVKNQ